MPGYKNIVPFVCKRPAEFLHFAFHLKFPDSDAVKSLTVYFRLGNIDLIILQFESRLES